MPMLGLIPAPDALAQRSRSGSSNRNTSSHQGGRTTVSGGDFPSWERDVSVGESVPLPTGRPGHFVPGEAADIGGLPLGVVPLADGRFATALADGGVVFVADDATILARVETAPCSQAPAVIASNVIATMGKSVARVAPDGILWSSEQAAELAIPPRVSLDVVPTISCAMVDGSITSLESATGRVQWTAQVGAAPRAMSLLADVLVVATASGDVVGLDRADGHELWRANIGTSCSALIADGSAAWVSGRGPSSRNKDEGPIIARIPLAKAGRALASGRNWKLRVGGDCDADPVLLDGLVAFTCHDGYVRAIDRVKGVGGWRTDLPARAWHVPLLAGGRLDFVLDQTPFIVALEAGNGAVLGWSELADEDEIFVGPAAWTGNVTAAATSLGRIVMMRWAWDEKLEEEDIHPRDHFGGSDSTTGAQGSYRP